MNVQQTWVTERLLYRVRRGTATEHDVRAMIELLPMWQPIGEATPEPLLDVLVVWRSAFFEDSPTIDLAYRKPDGRWVLTGSEPEQAIVPTHWMPLPPLPDDVVMTEDEPLGMEAGMPS